MEHIIFYSWQSDLNYKINKDFIRDAIRKAKKKIETERNIRIRLDEATRDELGSVHIGESIEKKIRQADIFICDISIINKDDAETRKTPNPNVLYELGLASETVNWDNIIIINNTAKGRHDDLPFDIKFRRAIEYKIAEHNLYNKEYIKTEKKKLATSIYEALKILPYIKPKLRLREIIQNLNNTNWNAFNFVDGKIQKEIKGKVDITQEYHNIFTLKFKSYEENNRNEKGDWEARFFINQETLTTADLAFRSTVDFGFKKLIFPLDRQYQEIYILGQTSYGSQVLQRQL